MNIKDFIIDGEIPEKEKKEKAKRGEIEYVFTLEYENDTDFILKKTTQNTEKLLVVLVSQAQCYIKDVKKNIVEKITNDKDLISFRRGMKELPKFTKLTWKPFRESYRGSYWSESKYITSSLALDSFIEKPKTYQFLCNKKLNPFEDTALVRRYEQNPEGFARINEVLKIVRLFKPDFTTSHSDYTNISRNIIDAHIDYNMIKVNLPIIEEMGVNTFISILRESQFASLLKDYLCDFSRLLKYFLYTIIYRNGLSVGYYGDFSLSQYADYLRMQKDMYGYVKDKYPLYWLSEKQMMNNKYNNWRKLREIHAFSLEQEKMKKYEYEDDVYKVIVPMESSDILDEAQQQQHCVASYIDRIKKGETHILFIRLKLNEEESCLTVQVTPKGEIVQVRGFQNRDYTSMEYCFMKKWAEEKGLSLEVKEVV